jgi:hypothetical protein
MMRKDLAAARVAWLEEATSDEDRQDPESSDFLLYKSSEGVFCDFHSNRHTFVSNLSRVGVPLAMTQKLARHSTHV